MFIVGGYFQVRSICVKGFRCHFQVRTDRNFWSIADNALRCLLVVSGPVDTLGSLNLVERKSDFENCKKETLPSQ